MKIGIVGLGYVGIQLGVAFGRIYDTIGFDPDENKINSYKSGVDQSGELTSSQLLESTGLVFSSESKDLTGCSIFIVAVPTPVDDENQPNFGSLISASETIGAVLEKENIVVYESTVFPGATEEICIPVLESVSGLRWKSDFHVGYSPERINPGDPDHTLSAITKVVAGDDEATLEQLAELYASIIPAGVHRASSIKVAEAAKVIENTQRDLNIALVNELAMIFDKLDIDTREVLEAAGSKWNFVPFAPGLVGGHCIGVDPYYLTHKAQLIGYQPQVILAGRRINDAMGSFIANKTMELMALCGISQGSPINVLGLTFKENCSDVRNSQVFGLIERFQNQGSVVCVADPVVDPDFIRNNHGIEIISIDQMQDAPVVVATVPHAAFGSGRDLVKKVLRKPGLFVDVKSAYRRAVDGVSDLKYWSL